LSPVSGPPQSIANQAFYNLPMVTRICAVGFVFACGWLAMPSNAQNMQENGLKPNGIQHKQLLNQEQIGADKGQKIERIRQEDALTRIDEVRVGGQTQSIDVQPKADVPAYQVAPIAGGSAGPAQQGSPPSAQGVRTWKIFSF
jgi:hypothetical protein